ncbi:MAG: hypothetical protein ACK55Z_34240, partial [bacterium]
DDFVTGLAPISAWKSDATPFTNEEIDLFIIQAKQSALESIQSDGVTNYLKLDDSIKMVEDDLKVLQQQIPLNLGEQQKWDALRKVFIRQQQLKRLQYLKGIAKAQSDLYEASSLG